MRMFETGVLVVGGGPTGLSAALFLAHQQVRVTLVERRPSTTPLPQARAFNPRTMEIYRAHGLEPAIRAHTSVLADRPEMIGAETLAGPTRFRVDVLSQERPPAGVSPTDWALVDQDDLEAEVRTAAEKAGADVRFGVEAGEVTVDGEGVSARLRELATGAETLVRAHYVIAADGNRAGLRARFGVGAEELAPVAHAAHFLVEGDIAAVAGDRRFLLAYLDRPVTGTVLVPMRQPGRWMVGVPHEPVGGDPSPEECLAFARAAVGVPDLPLTLVPALPGGRVVSTTTIGAWLARSYRAGRLLFAGDAAHVMPPAGSYGASTGIADAHNLAWKLAAVLRGDAGDALLDTYEAERRPVAATTIDTSLQLLGNRHHAEGADATRVDDISMIFGYRYRSTAVCTEPGTPAGPVADPRIPSGCPGLRVPHLPLPGGASTTDLCTGGFTLLACADGWEGAGVEVQRFDPKYRDLLGVGDTGASLVRPDGFVAWRCTDRPDRPARELRRVLDVVLARP
ncbi:FAD-dependent monooxygenase [Pseudonocardia sp. CA-107938]|uniref:FAD-dependent monooxygenase n=1 Tax=Pseudonocardia sp. CA-107938 TaxID=3240021 RepID=UPI003D934815